MTEEQRKQNTKFMIRYMSIITGIIGAYIGAYVAGLMSQHGVDLGTAFRMIPSQLGDFQFLPPLNAAAVAGIFIGGGLLGGIMIFALKVDSTGTILISWMRLPVQAAS